jgi:hypothetical protein
VAARAPRRAAASAGAAAVRGRPWSEEERDRHRQIAVELDLAQYLTKGYHGPRWTEEQIAWLGALPDDEVARRTERTANAVRQKREELGIINPAATPGRPKRTSGCARSR